jgi:hypothetical protein
MTPAACAVTGCSSVPGVCAANMPSAHAIIAFVSRSHWAAARNTMRGSAQ